MSTPVIPGDGPDAVLARVATLHKVPLARGVIERSVAAHPRPTSLVALVDVGRQIGLTMKPVQANEAALDDLALPAIIHFDTPGGGAFGVLEEVTATGFRVWGRKTGARVVDRDTFVRQWSGVLVIVEPVASHGRGRTRRRLGAAISGGFEPPAVAGGPGSTAVRAILGGLLGILVAWGVAAQPASTRLWVAVLVGLSVLGLAITVTMTRAISAYGGPFSPGICRRGKLVDCQSVLTSRFARVFGFPLSELGISFYAAVLLALATTAAGGASSVLVVVGAAFVTALPVAAILIGIQIAMRRVCTLCLAVHAVNISAAAVAWFLVLDALPPAENVIRAGALLILMFCLVLFFVVPYFKRNTALVRLSATHGAMAASPFGSLAQLSTERPTGLVGSSCGLPLGQGSASDELVVFLHPACNQCGPLLREVRSLASSGRVEVVAAVLPMDENERGSCEAVISVGLAAGTDLFMQGYAVAKERFRELTVSHDPAAVLADALSLDHAAVRARTAEAHALVASSEDFAADHVEGTPAVFFNSLPYRGSLSHLLTLLTDHFELLPRPVRPEAAPERVSQP